MSDTNPRPAPLPAGATWWIFAAFGILFIIYGVYAFTLPYAQPDHWSDIANSQETVVYIADNFKWLGMVSGMFGLLTLAVSYGAFRRAQKWAWMAFTSFPIFFLFAIFFTWPGLLWSPFLLGSILGLWLPYKSFFSAT